MIAKIFPRVSKTVCCVMCVCFKIKTSKKGGSNLRGGYVGEYNGNILRSSYEYIYAKILEYDKLNYKYEQETYLIDNKSYYTPYFFLYDNNNTLYKIVEIRGRRFGIEERKKDIAKLKKILPEIQICIYTETDLNKMCKDRNMSYHRLKTFWRESPSTIRSLNKGEINPMYGKHHKESTIKLLSEKGKERYKDNPEIYKQTTQKMLEWCRNDNYNFLRGERVPRFVLVCEWCGNKFTVINGHKNKRKFCCNKCAASYSSIVAAEKAINEKSKRNQEIKKFILDWTKDNESIILNTPYNKIEPSLSDLFYEIEKKFNIIDARTITDSFGVKSRKKFLKILKEHIENENMS